jgi:hypothetical protein
VHEVARIETRFFLARATRWIAFDFLEQAKSGGSATREEAKAMAAAAREYVLAERTIEGNV